MLRGKMPDKIESRLKCMFYGESKVGKTYAAIQFPKPYVIAVEDGVKNEEYLEILKKNGGCVFQTMDFEDIIKEIETLTSIKHDYKTLVIDSLSLIYSDLLDKSALKLKKIGFGQHYQDANRQIKRLLSLLFRLDMNVIVISHAKDVYTLSNGERVKVGSSFDCYSKLDYYFDFVFEITRHGSKRIAFVKGTRDRHKFPEDSSFEFSYDAFASRYGKSIIEKEAVPVKMISQDQIDEFYKYFELGILTNELEKKWLNKAGVKSLSELSDETAVRCLNYLREKNKVN